MYPGSPITIPCSTYSISMDLVIDVSFWDSGPEAIGEDMHMYLKCFFHTRGRLIVKSIFSPASQCNVESDTDRSECSKAMHFIGGIRARYVQAKRHLWGSLDTGYAIRKVIMQELENRESLWLYQRKKSDVIEGISTYLTLSLFLRLFEAHICMGHLFILIGVSSIAFGQASMPPMITYWLKIFFWLRSSALIPNFFMIYYYEQYHRWNVFERWERSLSSNENNNYDKIVIKDQEYICQKPLVKAREDSANHLDEIASGGTVSYLGKRPSLSYQRSSYDIFDWLATPVSGFIFYIIPQIHVQISHLWTEQLKYTVATKPTMDSFQLIVNDD